MHPLGKLREFDSGYLYGTTHVGIGRNRLCTCCRSWDDRRGRGDRQQASRNSRKPILGDQNEQF
jgi:hypothetical protein